MFMRVKRISFALSRDSFPEIQQGEKYEAMDLGITGFGFAANGYASRDG